MFSTEMVLISCTNKKQELGKQACRNSEMKSRHSMWSVWGEIQSEWVNCCPVALVLLLCDQNGFPGDTASRQHLNCWMNETTWVKWAVWTQAELWDTVPYFLSLFTYFRAQMWPVQGGIHVDPRTLHVVAGNWQKERVLVCRRVFVACWATQRSSSAGAVHCHGTAVVNAVTCLLPEPGCPSFSVRAEQFQDPAVNDQNCSCSSYLPFTVSPETRGMKRKHFLKGPTSSHCIQKSPFLPPSLSSFLQVRW